MGRRPARPPARTCQRSGRGPDDEQPFRQSPGTAPILLLGAVAILRSPRSKMGLSPSVPLTCLASKPGPRGAPHRPPCPAGRRHAGALRGVAPPRGPAQARPRWGHQTDQRRSGQIDHALSHSSHRNANAGGRHLRRAVRVGRCPGSARRLRQARRQRLLRSDVAGSKRFAQHRGARHRDSVRHVGQPDRRGPRAGIEGPANAGRSVPGRRSDLAGRDRFDHRPVDQRLCRTGQLRDGRGHR